MLLLVLSPLGVAAQTGATGAQPTAVYYPDATWAHRPPADAGINAALLKDAIDFAVASETKAPRDLVMNHYQTFGREPFAMRSGPIRERGSRRADRPSRLHRRRMGEPLRVDMTQRHQELSVEPVGIASTPHDQGASTIRSAMTWRRSSSTS